jgi:hypothetical protein
VLTDKVSLRLYCIAACPPSVCLWPTTHVDRSEILIVIGSLLEKNWRLLFLGSFISSISSVIETVNLDRFRHDSMASVLALTAFVVACPLFNDFA